MAENLTTATIDVRANTRGMEKDILKALRTVEFSEINTKKSSQALGRITGQVTEFNKSLEASNARVIAFGASAGAIFAVEKAISSLITSTIEVEKRLADINVLLGLSASNLEKFGSSLFGIAKNTAQTFSTVAEAATELSRQGLGVEETLKRTNAALILTRLSGLDAKASVDALTATLNSFSGSALDAVEVVNKLANVDAAFAVSSADLANAISRVGSTAVDAGVSLDELIALVTSAQQTTARGGAVIGNSFKTIFTRLQRGKVQDLLGSLGVDTSEGQSAVSLLQQLATTYDQLGSVQKSYIAEQVGGVFQINILKAALSDLGKEYSIYGRALETSLSSTDQAIQRNKLLNETISALSSQAFSNLEQAANKIGSIVFEPNAKGFLKGFNELLSSFNNIDAESAGAKLMSGFFTGIANFIGGPGAVLATAVLVKLFAKLAQFAAGSAKELLGTNKAAQQQAAIEQSILGILQKNSQFTSQILSGKITTVQAEKEMLNYLTAQSNILREQERLSKVIGANLSKAGVSIGKSGIPMTPAPKTKAAASGYIPNFATGAAIGQAMENAGAKQHGYKAGKARKTTIHDGNGKSFKSFVNSKEDVKTFTNAAGKKATIVRPPNGFGENTQYAANGFVPNFVKPKGYKITDGDSTLNLNDKMAGRLLRVDAIESWQKYGKKATSLAQQILPNQFPNVESLLGSSPKKAAYNRYSFDSALLQKELINQGLGVPDLRYSGNTYKSQTMAAMNKNVGLWSDKRNGFHIHPKAQQFIKQNNLEKKLSTNSDVDEKKKKFILGSVTRFGTGRYGGKLLPRKYTGSGNKLNFEKINFASGFIPNFASAKASDRMTQMVMDRFYPITDPVQFKKEYDIQSFKPAALKALYRERVEGGASTLTGRAGLANQKAAAASDVTVKDLKAPDYTMIHAGSEPFKRSFASYTKTDEKTGKKTKYVASIGVAGLNTKELNNSSIQERVGNALVGQANSLADIFNPTGGTRFSSPDQLSNTGSVYSAAGTVFESAIRGAFNVPAKGQGDRIDFPNPPESLRKFFPGAVGEYEAKITDTPDNRASALSKWVAINKLAAGFVPNFANRRVGYLDGDVLSDPKYAAAVEEQIASLNIKGGIPGYHKYLGELAKRNRKAGSLKKFTGVFGVPGAGKSSMMLGGKNAEKADNAKLRKTQRIPIITPADIDNVDEVVDTRASLVGTAAAIDQGYWSELDRLMILSSSTPGEQEEIKRRRSLRDSQILQGTSKTNFGREAGTSTAAGLDSAYIEAVALDILGSEKTRVMGIDSKFGLKRKKEQDLPIVERKKLGLAYGAFSPSTKGHLEMMEMAKERGITPEDFIVAVSREGGKLDENDPHSLRTLAFDQNTRKYLAQKTFQGANVIGAGSDFSGGIRRHLEVGSVGGRRKFLSAQSGSTAFVGSDKTEKDLVKYKQAGYDVAVGNRTEGISGTKAREAMLSGDYEALSKIFPEHVLPAIDQISPVMKNRTEAAQEIMSRISSRINKDLVPIENELSNLPGRITKNTPKEVQDRILALREARDELKAQKQKLPPKILKRLSGMFPDKYGVPLSSSGFVPNFAKSSGLSFLQKDKDEFGFSEIQAIMSGKRVGSFSYAEDKPGLVDVGDFTVNKSERGKGIGSELYKEAIRRNAGKKMKGQLLPQMNRLLQKIKNGEPVSAETLYPQIKRADLAKSSVFEVYGHKGMQVEKMTRDQFSSFVNAKINELKKDPKKLQSYFGNVEADEYGGLGVDLQTQHASGFVPNFAKNIKKEKTSRGMGGTTYVNKLGDYLETSFRQNQEGQKYIGIENVKRAGMLANGELTPKNKQSGVRSLYGNLFSDAKRSNTPIFSGRIINQASAKAKTGKPINDNTSNLDKMFYAFPQLKSRIDAEKKFKMPTSGTLTALSAPGVDNPVKFFKFKSVNELISHVNSLPKIPSSVLQDLTLQDLLTNPAFSGGFVPNFADQVRRNMYDWDGTIIPTIKGGAGDYIEQLKSLKEKDLLPIGKKLKAGKKKFDILTSRPSLFESAIRETSSRLGLPVNSINFGVKPKDKIAEAKKRGSKIVDDNLDLIGKSGFLNARVVNKRLSEGFVPNFASGGKTFKSYVSNSTDKAAKVVHPLKPIFAPDGTVSFPSMPGLYGNATVFHREAVFGKDKMTPRDFESIVELRKNDPRFWKRNSFEYINNAGGFIPNFSNALNDAIAREQSAGLSKSQIYVDSHSSLKNKNNPMGLMVANRRDEPMGGIQGIKRAKKEGRNPKTYGGAMSSGFIPNFALNDPETFTALAGKAFKGEGSEIESSRKQVEKTLKKFPELGSEFESVARNFEKLNSDIDDWIKKIREVNSSTSKSQPPSENISQTVGREIVFSRAGTTKQEKESARASQRRVAAEEKARRSAEGEGSYQTFAAGGRGSTANALVPFSPAATKAADVKKSRFAGLRSAGAKAVDFAGRNSFGIGFGLQTAAGMVAEYAGNDDTKQGRGMKAAISGVGDIASFAGTGAMIAGPVGALVGGLIGAGKAFIDYEKAVNSKLPDMERALQLSADSMNRFGESGQKLLTLNEQYADALASGDPSQATDIMVKTQRAYAEELSKLTEAQRSSMISAIAQGKGQEEYAKILGEMQNSVKAQETAASLTRFSESGGPFSGPDKKLVEGLDKSLVMDFTKNLDTSAIKAALDKSAAALSDPNFGTENQALDLMKNLASSESLTSDQKENLNKIIESFAAAAEKTDLSKVAEGLLKGVKDRPKSDEDVKKIEAANRANLEAAAAKVKKEIEIREKTNAMLIKLQSDTEAVYQRYNNSMEDFISSIETASQMMSAAGQYREEYLAQSGANQNIIDPIKEKNIVQKSNADLKIGIYKSQLETSNSFKSAVDGLLSGLQADSAKLGVGQSATDQSNRLLNIKSTLQQALLPIEGMITSGNYEGAKSETDRILRNLTPEETSAIGVDKVENAIVQLRSGIDQGARAQDLLVKNSQKDLAIQAQQLIFQKAMSKLTKAQNFGGTSNDILRDTEDSAFNKAIKSANTLRAGGYSQESLQQGKTRAVQGGGREAWGLNGRKPGPDMAATVIDFYKAAGEIGGESVISTESKDFGAITQALSDQLRKKLDQLSKAGAGVVDPAVFTRLEKNLATLGGGDKVSQLKLMKELGFANISGKKITDEAMKGYSGGAFAGLDPSLKKGFEATSDEGASATLLLLADQQKQTDSLNQGLESVVGTGLETNGLLSQQPAAIASAIGAILEKGRAEQKLSEAGNKAADLNAQYNDTSNKIQENSKIIQEAESKKAEAKAKIVESGVSEADLKDETKLQNAKSFFQGRSRDQYIAEESKKTGRAVSQSDYEKKYGKSGSLEERRKEYVGQQYDEQAKPLQDFINVVEDYNKVVKEQSDIITNKTSENKGLSEERKKTVKKQDESAKQVKVAQEDLFAKTTQANIKKTQNLDRGGAAGENYIKQNKAVREATLAKNLAMESDTISTEQQKKSRARSQGGGLSGRELTYDVNAGQMNTFEVAAMNQFGKGSRGAFDSLIKQQILPSFENFSKIYEDLGGKGYGREVYQQTRAELLGPEPVPKTKTAPVAPAAPPAPAANANTATSKPAASSAAPAAVSVPVVTPPPAVAPAPQQDTSQLISNILSTVQQIASEFQKQKEPEAVQGQQNTGTNNTNSGNTTADSNINVSNAVSLNISSSNGEVTDTAKVVAEQIKLGLTSFLNSPEFIGKVTTIANNAAGVKTPPTERRV